MAEHEGSCKACTGAHARTGESVIARGAVEAIVAKDGGGAEWAVAIVLHKCVHGGYDVTFASKSSPAISDEARHFCAHLLQHIRQDLAHVAHAHDTGPACATPTPTPTGEIQ